jgi:tetratricopeptide (TPR) repeat protein
MLSPPALENLVVEVLHQEADGDWSVGSGYIVGGALVLTAAHIIGPGKLQVRVNGIKRAAAIRLQGNKESSVFVDLALLEIRDEEEEIDAPFLRFGAVDRTSATLVEACWAVGFPGFKERRHKTKPRLRLTTQVNGEIPTGENVGHDLLSLHVTSTPGRSLRSGDLSESEWSGMSGSVVFAGDVVVGVISEHHRPEGQSSLGVVPITAIDKLPDRDDWWQLLGVDRLDLVSLPEEPWETRLKDEGLHVWTNADFRAGFAKHEDHHDVLPVEPGEPVNLALLRQGRLFNLQGDFANLVSRVDRWIASGPSQKRGPERLRVLWLEGQPGPHRSKALLACLSRAGEKGRAVYDAGTNLELAVDTLDGAIFAKRLPVPPLISVDLDGQPSSSLWNSLRNVIIKARTNFPAKRDPYSRMIDPYPRMIFAGTAEQGQAAEDVLQSLMEITPTDTRGRERQRPYSFHGMISMESESLAAKDVYNRGLPMTARRLFGREDELDTLRRAWASDRTRVLSVVASGGTGKSALINTWLRDMQESDYRGAQKVFAWSFYSQGTRDDLVSADPFINNALSWLDDDSSVSLNPWTKGFNLAALIKKHRFLLVLDGMEPLQYPLGAPNVGGQLTDDSVRAILDELSKADWQGLCIVTTRVPLTDLRQIEDLGLGGPGSVEELVLENLDAEAGADLLKHIIQTDADRGELQQAVERVEGHALAITLLGNYLRDVHNGDLAGMFDLEALSVEVRDGGHARRIMASYARWLEQNNRFAELALLLLIGLFDRPATPEAMKALLADRSLEIFTGELDDVGGAVWNRCVAALRGMGLLNNELPAQPGTLDAHPLIREHFRQELERRNSAFWQQGNRTLFEYYQHLAPLNASKAMDMTTLYAAVTHGCAAGLHQDVFETILLKRIWQGRRTNFSTRRLGMTGSDLVALSNYFQHRWTELRPSLSASARVLVMTNAGVRLRQLGRLVDARQCFGAVIDEIDEQSAKAGDFEDVSYAAAQYCELLVIAGMLTGPAGDRDTALVSGQRAVEYADRGNDPYFAMHARSSFAEVEFMLGKLERADQLFEEAKAIDRERKPRPPFLYSQGLFRYGYYLIETNRAGRIVHDSQETPHWGKDREDSSLLSEAIRLLIVGAAYRSFIEHGDGAASMTVRAENLLDESISAFQTAGYADYLVRGLLERAHFYRVRGNRNDYVSALEDLEKATFTAARGSMDLLYTDILLQRAACYLRFLPTMSTREQVATRSKIAPLLAEAGGLIDALRYGRRQDMLAQLHEAASRLL